MRVAANRVRGHKVISYDNEVLGTIDDFMLDTRTGRPGYAILSFPESGGEKLIPVPIRALTIDNEGRRFLLNADRKSLGFAPAFERNSRPDTGDPRWRSGVDSYYSF